MKDYLQLRLYRFSLNSKVGIEEYMFVWIVDLEWQDSSAEKFSNICRKSIVLIFIQLEYPYNYSADSMYVLR